MARVRVDRWGPHLDVIERTGVSISQYAREHGMAAHSLSAMQSASFAQIAQGRRCCNAQSAGASAQGLALRARADT